MPTKSTWTITGTIAALLIIALLAVTVPVTRGALEQTACDWAGLACERAPDPPPPEEDTDRRVELPPIEAATWGHYAALGDSYSSGDGADDYAAATTKDLACYRSANAYPELVAEGREFAGGLLFLACSSERGWRMLEELGEPGAQITGISPQTSLVTLGIGGNDLGFSTVLQTCMLRVPFVDHYACVNQEEEIEERMQEFGDTFDELLTEIRDRAPDARVLFVGYPRIFPENPSGMYYTLSSSDQEWLNATTERFNRLLSEAVAEADAEIAEDGGVGSVEFVDVYEALDGHEVGSAKPWVHGVVLDRAGDRPLDIDRSTFHPNADGQAAISTRVDARIESGPDRPIHVTRSTLENLSPELLAVE